MVISRAHARILLAGFGNVGQPFARLLLDRANLLADTYGLTATLVAVVDSSGAAIAQDGLNILDLLAAKQAGGVALLHGAGQARMNTLDAMARSGANIVVEASPSDLRTGGPALDVIRRALQQGLHVVTANKGPMVVAYGDLHDRAAHHGVALRFAATVGAPLPIVETCQYGLPACHIMGFATIPNATSNCVLHLMEEGYSLEDGVRRAQDLGIAETDPSLDLDGWDTAAKVVILANALLDIPATLDDVRVTGIRGVSRADLTAARAAGRAIKLVGTAARDGGAPTGTGGNWSLSVAPTTLEGNYPLARIDDTSMAIVLETDLIGSVVLATEGAAPLSTAAAVLRDIINIARQYAL